MGELTTKKRKNLKKSQFGLPGSRKYPIPDRAHAANAKARATQAKNAGNISEDAFARVMAKANKMLDEK